MTTPATSPCNKTTENFTRREWLLVFAIFMMIEAWILNVSYGFRSEQDVINYISFAATIASLLLAVLAIIYGFFQSDAQQKTAVAARLQLESMQAVQQTLGHTAGGMADHLKQISSTTALLTAISESLDSTHSKLGSMEGNITSLRTQQEALQASLIAGKERSTAREAAVSNSTETAAFPSPASIKYATEQILRTTSFQADLVGYALSRAFQLSGKTEIPLWKFIDQFIANPLGAANSFRMGSPQWRDYAMQMLLVLRSFQVVTLKFFPDTPFKSTISVTEEIKAYIADLTPPTLTTEATKQFAELIDSSNW